MTDTTTRGRRPSVPQPPVAPPGIGAPEIGDQMPDVYRDPSTGRIVAGGRSRKRGAGGNPFDIPPEIIPPNMGYQWVAVRVFNQGQVGHEQHMRNNGWTDVPTERHPGVFLPVEAKGPIEIDGLRLMENRIELITEARTEEKANADRPVRQVERSFGIKGNTAFDTNDPRARGATFAQQQIGPVNIPLE